MNYYAYDFIFDGVPSEKFDVFICKMDSGSSSEDGGGNVTIHTDKTPSMDFNYLLGIEYEDVFEFTFTFGSKSPKDRFDVSLINNWLIGHGQYKRLQILQPDMTYVYFNCIINDYKVTSFGNLPYAFECTVVCDRGWALESQKEYVYNIIQSPQTIFHNNTSHKNGYVLPRLEFTTNTPNATVSIVNVTNDNYETKLTGLSNNETIVLYCQKEIITSSLGVRRLSNFNNHWFELVQGNNRLNITGNISQLKIKYENARKVGA